MSAAQGVNLAPVHVSSDITSYDMNQINKANQQQASDFSNIGNSIRDAIAKAMQMYAPNSNNQDTVNQAQALGQQNNVTDFNQAAGNAAQTLNPIYSPYMQNGAQASNQLNSMLGLGANPMNSQQIYEQYLNNPAVQAQMQQGGQAINNNYAAKGGLGSGALMKALNSFGQGVAAQQIGSVQDRLAAQAAAGATAANQYAASLLNQYGTQQQAQTNQAQNQTALLNAQNLANQQYGTAANNQAGILAQLTNANTNAQTQAALARQSALVNTATKVQDKVGYTNGIMGGLVNTTNTSMNLS